MSAPIPAEPPPLDGGSRRLWCDLIRGRLGIDLGRDGPNLQDGFLRRRLWSRMRTLEIGTYGDYLDRVRGGGDEWERLVDLLVVPESRFFRHGPTFDALMTRVLPALCDRRPEQGIHMMSIGCARGQEAYSLAMAAHRVLGPDAGVRVTGTDVSRSALDSARRGVYTAAEVREALRRHCEHYLAPIAGTTARSRRYRVREMIRRIVRFRLADLRERDPGESATADLVFCQNVLIYFLRKDRAEALAALLERLRPGGYLFLAPGELVGATVVGARLVPFAETLCYRRRKEAVHVQIVD